MTSWFTLSSIKIIDNSCDVGDFYIFLAYDIYTDLRQAWLNNQSKNGDLMNWAYRNSLKI